MLQVPDKVEADGTLSPDYKTKHNVDIRCHVCRWREFCLPAFLTEDEIRSFESVIVERRKVSANELIYHQGQSFNAIFAILSGAVKKYRVLHDGQVSVTDFCLPGELFGYSGIDQGYYSVNAVALRDTLVCVMPFEELKKASPEIPALQSRLIHLMSEQIKKHQQRLVQFRGRNTLQARFAMFLLDIACRSAKRGESATRIRLPMTRQDLGNYLGITTESVSRELTALVNSGAITKNHRDITILDFETLRSSVFLGTENGRGFGNENFDIF